MVTRHNAHADAQLLNQKFYEIEDTNTHFKSMKRARSFAKCITDLLYICMHYKVLSVFSKFGKPLISIVIAIKSHLQCRAHYSSLRKVQQ